MGAGRRALPAQLKLMQGNASKANEKQLAAAAAAEAAVPAPVTLPCPKNIKGEAKAEWIRLAPALLQQGLLKELDTGVFRMMCESWGRYLEYEALCTKVGPELALKLRYRREANQAFTRYLRTAVEFGLSPSSRSGTRGRVPSPGGTPDTPPVNTTAAKAKAKANGFFRRS
jgi:P27 family predicted phage terminase small subunit